MNILIVSTSQFGYLVDYHRYYTYLKGKGHDVKYICWDFGREKLEPGNADVMYVSRNGHMVARLSRFIKAVAKYEKENQCDRILINCFKLVSTLLLFIPNSKMYLDIRQVSVNTKKYKRFLFDRMMEFAAKRFKNTSILTDLAASHLHISRYKLLPLGGAYFDPSDKHDPAIDQYRGLFDNNDFIFLYVGTLHRRRIIDCVEGFNGYLKKNRLTEVRFIIIGDAIGNDLINIKKYIADNKLENYIFPLGYIPQQRLSLFFQHADCGITYFPITPFNDVQPNTKTYEYLINGIPVIATATKDNIRLLTDPVVPSGIVIEDNPAAFEKAVTDILANRNLYHKQDIIRQFSRYQWDNLFREHLNDVLDLPDEKHAMAV